MTGKPLGIRVRQNATTLSFLAPALLGIAVFFLYPLVSAVYFSFTKFDLLSVPQWVGLDNYKRMASDPFLLQSVRNTLWMVVVFVPARIIAAIGLSMLLTQLKRGAGFFRTIFYLPSLVSPVAATIAFVYLLKPGTGPVNHLLGLIGIDGPLWFKSITLPTIRPVILFAAVTGVIYTLQYFDQAAVAGSIASGQATTGGGISSNFGFPEGSTFTYPLWLYTVGFRYNALGYANALAIALFAVAFAVTVILMRRAKAFSGEEM